MANPEKLDTPELSPEGKVINESRKGLNSLKDEFMNLGMQIKSPEQDANQNTLKKFLEEHPDLKKQLDEGTKKISEKLKDGSTKGLEQVNLQPVSIAINDTTKDSVNDKTIKNISKRIITPEEAARLKAMEKFLEEHPDLKKQLDERRKKFREANKNHNNK